MKPGTESFERNGVAAALAAYIFWGLAPLYFKLIQSVGPIEIIAHRILWAIPVLAGFLLLRDGSGFWQRMRLPPRTILILLITGSLVALNWLIFVWAVVNGQVLATSLGYFIGPLVNFLLGFAGTSMGELFGYLFSPIAFCMGVDKGDALRVGSLLGTKVAINEFVGYLDLVALKGQISERSFVIATYALCGFANFGSIGIALGGIGQIAPGRRADLARLGLKTMFGGALASWITASIAGMLI